MPDTITNGFIAGILQFAREDHAHGIPLYAPTNTGHALERRIQVTAYDQRVDRRVGDQHQIRSVYTAARWFLEYHDSADARD